MKRDTGIVLTLWGIVSLMIISGGVCGIRFNSTPSYPRGFYQEISGTARRGDFVLFCPPKTPAIDMAVKRGYLAPGSCPGGCLPMLKKVFGMPGDRVVITKDGVTVNGRLVRNSKLDTLDPAGRRLPRFRMDRTLSPGQVFLMSDYNPRSFDARYFGPIRGSNIISVVRPLFTWR
ncbi:MAG: conjugative transfer signal peptidase TraF [Syntrophobacteraceae bacterium]